jgi:hypothetical protein
VPNKLTRKQKEKKNKEKEKKKKNLLDKRVKSNVKKSIHQNRV